MTNWESVNLSGTMDRGSGNVADLYFQICDLYLLYYL